MRNLRRPLIGMVIAALSFATITGAGVRIRDSSLGETEKQILISAIVIAVAGILLIFDLAVAGTKFTLLGVWSALLTLGTGFWAIWMVWGHDPNDELRNYLVAFAIASASLAQICLLIGWGARFKLVVAITALLALAVAGAAGYYLFGPAEHPDWLVPAGVTLASLDALGTLVALVATFVEHRSAIDPYGDPPFTTPLRERYGQPLDSEWLPLADEAPALTMWEEAIGTQPSGTGPEELASAAFGDNDRAAHPAATPAFDPATHRVWTESWQADRMDAESDLESASEALSEAPLGAVSLADAEPEVEAEAQPAAEPDPVPAASIPSAAPSGGSGPILQNGSTVLLSAEVEWQLLESSRKFGMTPDEIVLAALDGINELDAEDD
jgi:signal transduction histidine kinase